MNPSLSRRAFLKGGVATAATAVTAAALPGAAEAADPGGYLTTLFDLSLCVGCGECVTACKEAHEKNFPRPEKPFPAMVPSRVPVEDFSDEKDEEGRLTPYNWLTIQEAEVSVDGEEYTLYIPRRCMHCVNPPCVKLCPWGAAVQEKNGLSRINDALCLGGAKCRKACPWHIPQRQTGVGLYLDILPSLAGNGVMYKCDRCHDRLKDGELPACIDACPEGVQSIGPRDEMIEKAKALAAETNGYIYGLEENGGTNTLYVSPVPFETLNRAVEKGAGLPDLAPHGNSMAMAENMGAALLLAPLAGFAAAAGRIFFKLKKAAKQENAS
ncbi:4Fe-4S dicluster domain-containing protein [Desulfoluna spongiiphila]|uniref:Fe-S-cluster-containing dehydrogenase component n=1 Tax=Desulfoluna spongiiphila TaxID=419481 RepID=A0A1G5BQ10_9BACT|nr:4Fe-4S dicluster domain-containing protein [Desulfoluna spongiiphila]SCX92299.1 Fe-S-cluster-containing dehydrogenase component [Desulfoluna spongiiphila]VVS93856.1 twin-arginine translocation pathway signal sequence [Desulfoluna spongiiphila]